MVRCIYFNFSTLNKQNRTTGYITIVILDTPQVGREIRVNTRKMTKRFAYIAEKQYLCTLNQNTHIMEEKIKSKAIVMYAEYPVRGGNMTNVKLTFRWEEAYDVITKEKDGFNRNVYTDLDYDYNRDRVKVEGHNDVRVTVEYDGKETQEDKCIRSQTKHLLFRITDEELTQLILENKVPERVVGRISIIVYHGVPNNMIGFLAKEGSTIAIRHMHDEFKHDEMFGSESEHALFPIGEAFHPYGSGTYEGYRSNEPRTAIWFDGYDEHKGDLLITIENYKGQTVYETYLFKDGF